MAVCRFCAAVVLAWSVAGVTGCGKSPAAPTGTVRDPLAACLARATFGDPTQSPYLLPFQVGTSSRLYQTYCGSPNHGTDNQLAYDFELPLESPILAARAGVVMVVRDTHEDSDQYDREFNYVYIQHDDRTVAFYAHLRQHSVTVSVGDRVLAGQQIARLGHLGNPVADLLHFGVYPNALSLSEDLAVNFRNAEGPLDGRRGLVQDAVYRAVPY